MERTLAALAIGEHATVRALHCAGRERRRLLELGFVPGAEVQALHRAPFGDPVAYGICGAVIALRRADSAHIIIDS